MLLNWFYWFANYSVVSTHVILWYVLSPHSVTSKAISLRASHIIGVVVYVSIFSVTCVVFSGTTLCIVCVWIYYSISISCWLILYIYTCAFVKIRNLYVNSLVEFFPYRVFLKLYMEIPIVEIFRLFGSPVLCVLKNVSLFTRTSVTLLVVTLLLVSMQRLMISLTLLNLKDISLKQMVSPMLNSLLVYAVH